MTLSLRRVAALGLILGALGACASTGPKLLERSASRLPDWAGKTWTDKDTAYFSGSSTGGEAFEDARELAVRDAMKPLLEYFGVRSEVKMRQIISQDSRALLDQYSGKSVQAQLLGLTVKEVYHERWRTEAGDDAYKVHVLLAYPMANLDAEKQRLAAKELEGSLDVAQALKLGKQALLKPDLMAAFHDYDLALASGAKDHSEGLAPLSQAFFAALDELRLKAEQPSPMLCGLNPGLLRAHAWLGTVALEGLPFILAPAAPVLSGPGGALAIPLTWLASPGAQQAEARLDLSSCPELERLLAKEGRSLPVLHWSWQARVPKPAKALALNAEGDSAWAAGLKAGLENIGYQVLPANATAAWHLEARLTLEESQDPELQVASCKETVTLKLGSPAGPSQAQLPPSTGSAGSQAQAKAKALASAIDATCQWLAGFQGVRP